MSNIEKFIFDAFVEELESCVHTGSGGGLTEYGCGHAAVLTSIAANALRHVRTAEQGELVQQPITQAKAAEALPEGEICPDCKGAGNVMVQHVNQCHKCSGTGKLPLA